MDQVTPLIDSTQGLVACYETVTVYIKVCHRQFQNKKAESLLTLPLMPFDFVLMLALKLSPKCYKTD